MVKKKVFLCPTFFLLFLFFVGCSQDSTKPTPEDQEAAESPNVIKISSSDSPSTLDPRQARDLPSVSFIRMLFEGLMRHDLDGKLVPGIAEEVEVSEDLKTYTFKLRESHWSNGDKVTAEDFVYTWKTILDPAFPAPNAYQLFPIKGAKAAKEGHAPLEDIGVSALNPKTLVVELETPTPYFLELVDFHAYYPINAKVDKKNPDWAEDGPKAFVSNGPFQLDRWAFHDVIVVKKNLHYWGADSVQLDKVETLFLEENTAFQMFQRGSLDWAGSPLSTIPPDAIATLKRANILSITPAAGTHWFRFNTHAKPFDHPKVRKAFSYAIDRNALVEHITQGNQLPAMGIIPPTMSLQEEGYFQDYNVAKAQQLFEEYLKEANITREQLPTITLCYTNSERNHKIAQAVQQQWNTIFDIHVILESNEGKLFFEKLKSQNYQIATGSWYADIRDPINFLEVFKFQNNGTNNTGWENPQYIALLDQSSLEKNPEKRQEILRQAEALLMEEMPIAPLFFGAFNYVKQHRVKNVYLSDLGYLDFKNAYLDTATPRLFIPPQ